MEDIRQKEYTEKVIREQIIINRIKFIKANWWKLLIVIFILTILIFPGFYGSLIGNWINNFFGSIIKSINF